MEVPVYFDMGGSGHWGDMPLERALAWTRVFHRRQPSIPGTIIWMVRPNLEKGIPAGFTDWSMRARVAESFGFTPERYEQYFAAMDDVDPAEYPAHPDNHKVPGGLKPVRPFDTDLAARWLQLVEGGSAPRDAAATALTR